MNRFVCCLAGVLIAVWAMQSAVASKKAIPAATQRVVDKANDYIIRKLLRTEKRFFPYLTAVATLHNVQTIKAIRASREAETTSHEQQTGIQKPLPELPENAEKDAQKQLDGMFSHYANIFAGELGDKTERAVRNMLIRVFNEHHSLGLILIEDLYQQLDQFREAEKQERQAQVVNYLGTKQRKHDSVVSFIDELLESDSRRPKGRMRKSDGLDVIK